MDPLAEKNYSISPYAYCGGNPVNRIDPDGRLDMSGLLLLCAGANTAIRKVNAAIYNRLKSKYKVINRTYGDHIARNSSTSVNQPQIVRPIPIKQSTPMQQAAKTAQSQPQGEFKDANLEMYKNTVSNAMNDPVNKQLLTDPTFQFSASVILGGGPEAIISTSTKVGLFALENPHATEAIVGTGIGLFFSSFGQMQDVPSFKTGLPWIDNASQIVQTSMTAIDFFKSIAPQSNVQPVNNTDNEKK